MDRACLQEAIRSVAHQHHRPIELVLVNALGRAHSAWPAVVEELNVRLVADSAGRPMRRAVAAQAGLDAASGEWVLFLDDDDLLLPHHLSRLVKAGRACIEAAAVYADVELGREVDGAWQVQHLFAADFDAVRLLFENYLPIHAVLFRRDKLQPGMQFDAALDLFEDWDFWLQLAEQGNFVRVPGVSARYVAATSGHSAVFEDSASARQARAYLFEKWRQRLGLVRYEQLLGYVQTLFRSASRLEEELRALRRDHADYTSSLRSTLAQREREVADAAQYAASLRETLVHREREVADAADHAASLRETLTQREREVSDAADYTASLRESLVHRERELATLRAELVALHAEKPLQALARTLRRRTKPHGSRS